jgi:membrane protein DedA with SNARE-associated domain
MTRGDGIAISRTLSMRTPTIVAAAAILAAIVFSMGQAGVLAVMTKFVESTRVQRARGWVTDRVGAAVVSSRFVPGMRLPIYVAMGATGVSFAQFALWTLLAAGIWTPLLVLLVSNAGGLVVRPIEAYLGVGWISVGLAIIVGAIGARVLSLLTTEIGRARLVASISKLWRWEFWPAWLFYAPLVPWIAWLCVRHRCSPLVITAANPAIPHGGFVGESKYDILRALGASHIIPSELIRGGDVPDRLARLDRIIDERDWTYPLILKPDAGQRGAGVKLIRNRDEAVACLGSNELPVLVQMFHLGPYEAGIFYYRYPDEPRGRILSITDKHFSVLTGDGVSTIEQLIWRHPRFRMQAAVFLARHERDTRRILGKGESMQLALAGNHCQGTMFRDGSHLITPRLEHKIDQIARSFDGFYFGRFDVRYSDVERFKVGDDLTIIELNGVTSESTNFYDPSWSLWRAYRQLFQQWSILFKIAAQNRAGGHQPSRLRSLLADTIGFYRNRQGGLLAD